MTLPKSLTTLSAIGCASTAMLSLLAVSAHAATFDFAYTFANRTTFSARLDGSLGSDENILFINNINSFSLTDTNGTPVSSTAFSPRGVNADASLSLDGTFAAFAFGDLKPNGRGEVGFSLFNTPDNNSANPAFADASYLDVDVPIRTIEAFRNEGYLLQEIAQMQTEFVTPEVPQTVPEQASVVSLLFAAAGIGTRLKVRPVKSATLR